MKKTRILAIVLALVMVIGLAACGQTSSSSSQPQSETSAQASQPETGSAETPESTWPEDDVMMYIGYGAGGGSDLLARALAQYIDLGDHAMVCSNLTGGSGTIAMMECFNADPDGYSMNLCLPESFACLVLNGSLERQVFDDLIFLASPVYDVDALSVTKDSPYQTLEELIAYAKDHPGELTIAGVGSGLNKYCAIKIMQDLDIEFSYVPYADSNETRAAVLGGQADILLSQACEAKPYYDSGDMTVLAVCADERVSFMPDVRTFNEMGYDIVLGIHRGFAVTPGTPEEVVRDLEARVKAVYDNPDFQDYMHNELGFNTVWTGHDEYEALAAQAVEDFGPLMEAAADY